jgi:hypothetical protein
MNPSTLDPSLDTQNTRSKVYFERNLHETAANLFATSANRFAKSANRFVGHT